jgi:hypothetical protein
MSIESRLMNLEAQHHSNIPEQIYICFFIVSKTTPSGYRCGDVVITRDSEESIDDLRGRCCDFVAGSDPTTFSIFEPL